MAVIFSTIAASLALLVAVFGASWIAAAVFSKPSDKGHLTPRLSRRFVSSAFIFCILVFPFAAQLVYGGLDESLLVDIFLVNAAVVCVAWNISRPSSSPSAG